MTRTPSGLTAPRSLVYLLGLFSIALLLFSNAVIYAQDKDAPELKRSAESGLDDYVPTGKASTLYVDTRLTCFERNMLIFDEDLCVEKTSKKILGKDTDAEDKLESIRRQEWKARLESMLQELEARFLIDKSDEIKLKKEYSTKEYLAKGSSTMLPELLDTKTRLAMLKEAYSKLSNLSPQVSLLDAATRKRDADKNADNKKLRPAFLEIKREYEESITDLAEIYVKAEANPNIDQTVIASINSELSRGDTYFTERFLLELDRVKNHISNEGYQLKKAEIDDRYAQKYMLAAAHLGADDVAWMLVQLSSRVDTLRKVVNVLRENEPVLSKWFLGVPGLATPFLVYLLFRKKETEESDLRRRKEWREATEFELMELKKRQLENANIQAELEIEKKKIELERLKKNEIIVIATDEEIKKYSALAFFKQPVERRNKGDNYFGN